MRSRELATDRTPRLVLRFAVYTAVTLAVAAGALLWFFYGLTRERAEKDAAFHTGFIADTIVRDRLEPSDFAGAVSSARASVLDSLFRREVLVNGYRRVKLYSVNGAVTYSNDHSLIGTTPDKEDVEKAVSGANPTDVSTLNSEGGRGPDMRVLESYAPVEFGGSTVGVFELYEEYGPVAAAARATFLPIAGALGLALLVLYAALLPLLRSVTRRLQRQVKELEHQSLHDSLTGLPNRTYFRRHLSSALAEPDGEGLAVLLLGLDRFSEINDTLGHRRGDLVLQEVGRRLEAALAPGQLLARLDGDEFAVLAAASDDASAAELARRLRSELTVPLRLEDLVIEVGATAGIALHPDHADDADTLLQRADVAMYLAKQLHTDVEVYASDRDEHSPARLRLAGELRRAIETGEIVVHFQPQAALGNGVVHSVEALVRWQHPELGLLAPDVFVPLAERTGLIRPLTRHVLDTSLGQVARWRDQGLELSVAVNVTSRDLLDVALPEDVRSALERWKVAPDRLQLEITENTILTDPARARDVLIRLSGLGVRLGIDDFGSGNSPLRYLKGLPVDVLKIDREFVMSMETSADDAVIVHSTIELGHNLGLEVIAEGVETEATWRGLAQLGCDTAQGFFLGRPVPGGELAAVLLERERRVA